MRARSVHGYGVIVNWYRCTSEEELFLCLCSVRRQHQSYLCRYSLQKECSKGIKETFARGLTRSRISCQALMF